MDHIRAKKKKKKVKNTMQGTTGEIPTWTVH